jgi:hypothetical protein
MTFDKETMMGVLGLQPRQSIESRVFWAVAFALGGAAVGAGVALLLAPKAGDDLRKDLVQGAKAMVGPKNGQRVDGYEDPRIRASKTDGAGV